MCSCEDGSGWGESICGWLYFAYDWEIWFDVLVKMIPLGRPMLKMGIRAISGLC
jgi:hypothetical protein